MLSEKKLHSTLKENNDKKCYEAAESLPGQTVADESNDIPCPPMEFGGCGGGNLHLRCFFPLGWTKDLETSAEQIVGCYELPEIIDASSCCSICLVVGREANGSKQLQEAAMRENSNDNILYYPTLMDIHGDRLDHFQQHWGKSHPVIVRNVLPNTSELNWDPLVMFCAHLQNNIDKSKEVGEEFKDVSCPDWFEVSVIPFYT